MACAAVAGGAVCSVSFAASSPAVSSSSLSGSSSRVRFHVSSAAPSVRPVTKRMGRIVVMASAPEQVTGFVGSLLDKIKESISTAQEICSTDETSGECVVAWEEVEELSAAQAHRRESGSSQTGYVDPLDKYCEDNPEKDECRVYED